MLKPLLFILFALLTLAPSVRAQTPAAPPDYIVGAQDVLRIVVFDEPSLSNSYRVDADGSFQFPFLGRIVASGKSLREIEQLLSKQLEGGFVRRAQITVDIETFRVRSIFVIGEVRSPAKYTMTGQMTMLEALAAAGSVTQNAGTEILVLRASSGEGTQPVSPEAANLANVQRVSLADLQLGKLSENIRLQEGDTVFVPKAEKFYLTGQIKSPGAYTWERNLTVLQAISLAGGLTDKGSNRRMKVIRVVDGKKSETSVSMTDLVQAGDTIVVAQRLL